jgi:hypothetical protein
MPSAFANSDLPFRSPRSRRIGEAQFPTLDAQTRRTLLVDIIAAAIERAVAAALRDPDDNVVSGATDFLGFYEERTALNSLVSTLGDATGIQIARERRPEGLNAANLERWDGWRRARFAKAQGVERVRLALEYDLEPPSAIAETALTIKIDDHWNAHSLYEAVADRHPGAFAHALAERLKRGEALPHGTRRYLAEAENPAEALTKALGEDARWDAKANAGRLLGTDAMRPLLDELLAAENDPYFRHDQRRGAIFDTLEHAELAPLIETILAEPATAPGAAAVRAALLGGWKGGEDGQPLLPLDPDQRVRLADHVPRWSELLIADPASPRFRLSELARLIGRIGDQGLLPMLLALWDEDQRRSNAEHEESKANHGRAGPSRVRMSYDNDYRDAFVRIGGEAVTKAMVERFDDPGRELVAAVVLGQIHAVDPRKPGVIGPGHNESANRRAALAERATRAPEVNAAIILDRIDALLAAGDEPSVRRAIALTGPVLQMDYGNRVASLRALFDLAGEQYYLLNFAKTFGERGELIPATIVRSGIEAQSAKLRAQQWVPESDYWEVDEWLRLIAFSDDPLAALPDFAALPKGYGWRHRIGSLAFALGYSNSPNAAKALEALLGADQTLFSSSYWAVSLAQIGGDAAADILLDAVARIDDPKLWNDVHTVSSALANLIRAPGPRARAFQMLAEARFPSRQSLLGGAIAETMDEKDAISLLDLAAREGSAAIGRELIGRLEQAAVTRNPVPGHSNAYELEAAPLPGLRQHAFDMLRKELPASNWAHQCLQAIDHLRDRYGKPLAEPNHPYLDARLPWPGAASAGWKTIAIDWER